MAYTEKFSYSKIDTFKQCSYKYKLRYVDKHFLFSGSIATEFGTAIHETEEQIALYITRNESINYIKLKNEFILKCRKVALAYPDDFNKPDKSGYTYKEKMYFYLNKAIYNLEKFMHDHPNYKIVGIEQNFNFNYDDEHYFTGAIDRIFQNQDTGELIIQDIKSWSVAKKPNELKSPLQFAIYAMAAKEMFNVDTTKMTFEYYLPLLELTQKAITTDIISESTPIINKLFNGIASEDFKPTITALCHWCPHNPFTDSTLIEKDPDAICPYGSTWQQSGDDVKNTLVSWENIFNENTDKKIFIEQFKQLVKKSNNVPMLESNVN